MTTACPKCKKMMEHEDFLFEVVCDACKTRFNPFMQTNPEEVQEEPIQIQESSQELQSLPQNFNESVQAFKEIQDFGENIPPASQAPAKSKTPAKKAEPPKTSAIASRISSDFPVVFAPNLEHQEIDSHLEPISTFCALEDSEDPLQPGIRTLITKAQSVKAQAIVQLQIHFHPDGTKVLLSGIPVTLK